MTYSKYCVSFLLILSLCTCILKNINNYEPHFTSVDLLQSSTPPIFGEICNVISDLKCENCLGNSHKVAIVSVLLEKFQTGSSNILKSNVLKLLGQLDVCSDAVLMTILPCLTNYNVSCKICSHFNFKGNIII